VRGISVVSTESLSLCEKYRPKKIADFIGLSEPKIILQKMAARPQGRALLFEGKTGSGKTAMALAFAAEIPAQVYVLPAPDCTRGNIEKMWRTCQFTPRAGFKMHLILVDQADLLSKRRQLWLRSKIDGSEKLAHVIWVFTAIPTEKLDAGLRSRCMQFKFSTYGNSTAAAELLERVWQSEAPTAAPPNFARIVKEANGSIRAALMEIETELDKLRGHQSQLTREKAAP
jgi:replication-associated recombination protein RarA